MVLFFVLCFLLVCICVFVCVMSVCVWHLGVRQCHDGCFMRKRGQGEIRVKG